MSKIQVMSKLNKLPKTMSTDFWKDIVKSKEISNDITLEGFFGKRIANRIDKEISNNNLIL